MATSTFDKKIVLNRKAAKRLAEIASRPAPPRPSKEELDAYWAKRDKEANEWLSLHCQK